MDAGSFFALIGLIALCTAGVWFGIKRIRKNHYYHGHRRFYRANVTAIEPFTYVVLVGRYNSRYEERTGYNITVSWFEKDGSLHDAVVETKDHLLASCCEMSGKARIAVIRRRFGKRARDFDLLAPKPYKMESSRIRQPIGKPVIPEEPEMTPPPAPKPFVLDDRQDRAEHPDRFQHTEEEKALLRRTLGEEQAEKLLRAEDDLNTLYRLHPPEEIRQKREAHRRKVKNDLALNEQFDEEIVMFRSRYHAHTVYTVCYVLLILIPALAIPLMILIPAILQALGKI